MDKLKCLRDNYLILMNIGINHLTVVPCNYEQVEEDNSSEE